MRFRSAVIASMLTAVLAVLFVVLLSTEPASAEVSFTDATTSASPPASPGAYILTRESPHFSTPRSIETLWPLPTVVGTAPGTSTFSFWGRIDSGEPVTRIFVNGRDAGQVAPSENYSWLSVTFPTSYLDQGSDNSIDIFPKTEDGLRVAADGPGVDDVGEQNAVFIRNHDATNKDIGPSYGSIYARLSNEKPPADQGSVTPTSAPSSTGTLEQPTPPKPPPSKPCGDVNSDFDVDSVDAALVLQFVAGLISSLENIGSADPSRDGEITAVDALMILQRSARLIQTVLVCS